MAEPVKETPTTSGEQNPDEGVSALGLNPSAAGRDAGTDVSFEVEPLPSLEHDLSEQFASAATLEPADKSTLEREIPIQEEHVQKLLEEKGTAGNLSVTDIIHDDVRKKFARCSLTLRAIRAAKPEDKKPGYLGRDPCVSLFSSPSKKLLVLDIDRTLAFYAKETCLNAVAVTALLEGKPNFVYARQPNREFVWLLPHLPEFLEKCNSMYDVVVFSSAKQVHVKRMLRRIDPSRKYIKHYFTHEYTTKCSFEKRPGKVEMIDYLKDLKFLLDHKGQQNLVVIDDSITATALHFENAIPIPAFCGKQDDHELQKLLPFLEDLAAVPDVTAPIRARYGSLWQHLLEPERRGSDISAQVKHLSLEALLQGI
eukprot:jgi/Botrbrau1/21992/Bobra.0024s0009.1